MSEGTTLEMLFEYHLLVPEEYLARLATSAVDEEILKDLRSRNNSEPYNEEIDVTINDFKGYNSLSSSNHIIRNVSIQRMVKDTKMAKKIKTLYKDTCQLCRNKIKAQTVLFRRRIISNPITKPIKAMTLSLI
jgi:predicted restriction endonuclease